MIEIAAGSQDSQVKPFSVSIYDLHSTYWLSRDLGVPAAQTMSVLFPLHPPALF